MSLRSPMVYPDREQPPCSDEECPLPSSVANNLMIEKMRANGDAAALAAWRSKLERAIAAQRAVRAAQPAETKGDSEMCQCNERRDAERERAARAKMIADSAAAYRQPVATDATIDSEQPRTAGMNREAAARAELQRASRNAHKERR